MPSVHRYRDRKARERRRMKRLITTLLGPVLVCATLAPAAFCANVVGMVSDTQDHSIRGIEITVQNSAAKVVGRAMTDVQGHYQITGLAPDTYQFILNPLATGFKKGSGVSYLDAKGITINWKVSTDALALAFASAGAAEEIAGDPFGFSAGEFASLVTLGAGVVAVGVVGGLGAAGGFSGSSSSPSE